MGGFAIPLCLYSLFTVTLISSAVDTIDKTQFITDGEKIVSSNQSVEMGFFNPGGSNLRYVGIWYKISTGTVVWVANRDVPLTDTSGVLKIIDPGILVLLNSTNHTIWSTNTTRSVQNPVVQLLDSGNLVVREANGDGNFVWQSFDYPCDTLLPGMKLGQDSGSGKEWYISSWKSKDNPAKGDYAYRLDLRGYPQIFIKKGSTEVFRTGPWNGVWFSGTPRLRTNQFYTFGMHFEGQQVYYRYDLNLGSSSAVVFSRVIMNPNGVAEYSTLTDSNWVLDLNVPTDNCDTFKLCGPYSSCDVNINSGCSCLSKFVPKNQQEWAVNDWSSGCVRSTPLDCQKGDGFVTYSGIKLPDTRSSWFNATMTITECRELCLKNCSCTAYTSLDIRGSGSGCLIWIDDLVDMRAFIENDQDIYIRMSSSDLDAPTQKKGSNVKRRKIIAVTVPLFTGILLLGLCIYGQKRKKKNSQLKTEGGLFRYSHQGYTNQRRQKEDLELPLFDFSTIANSTDNFSTNCKLGEGGFGPVHKGRLEDGREIAVKRLSKNSRQGIDEFKNEVICMAKLQHRNLVKLLGCCIQGEERMLIYEFMPNKSLDTFIFDESKRALLDWPKRFNIVNGIARGILYLHRDSRLRIVHRDLKASNILLDIEMNPKISDFGMARIFGGNETEGNTNRVVGTFGYMSPEYQVDGLFSVKSDVFSFGVLVLEIVSGKRNRGFFHPDHHLNLLGHGWMLHNESRSMELVDPTLMDSCSPSEVLRLIHVSLLCVQQHPEDRPSMSSVVLMLGSEGSLPWPKQPGFFTERNLVDTDTTSSSKNPPIASNDFTITVMEPR